MADLNPNRATARTWTNDELATLRSMYVSGATEQEIAACLGRSISSVASARNAHLINRPRESLRRAPPWTATESALGASMYAAGASRAEIAAAVGRSEVSIKRAITTYGWKRDDGASFDPSIWDTEGEKWRTFGARPRYAVSSLGNVRSLLPGRIGNALKPWIDDDGYAHVQLSGGDGEKRFAVHVLVATTFHGARPSANMQVAHNDGNASNNAATNLRWATPRENQHDRYVHGTSSWSVDHAALGRAILRVANGTPVQPAARSEGIDEQSLRRVIHKLRQQQPA